ncbi:MAG: hypothetical protein P8L77_03440 [Gammaproteobacteria bacterium]|nr:hypothetical protein [Gammaproteobacteria bacterium]
MSLGYEAKNILEINLSNQANVDELNKAFKCPKKVKKNNIFHELFKPVLALLIGYTELCCILMALFPTSMLFMVAGVNLALIIWLGWDHFKAAQTSLKYLIPPITSMLAFMTMPLLMPTVIASWSILWSIGLALSTFSVAGISWYQRQSLSMETLITLAVTMAWIFSTLQLCIPALSVAFGAQIYFHDSMIILGVVGIAGYLKNSWTTSKEQWLVFENGQFQTKSMAAITEGHIIALEAGKAYPFPLRILNGSIQADYSIREDASDKIIKTVKKDGWLLPWAYTTNIKKGTQIYAEVGEFRKSNISRSPSWADKIAQYFLPSMLTIASLAASCWYVFAPQSFAISFAIKAFMGVLMAACPCVLAVVAPICEAIGKAKVSKELHTHFKEQVSVGHLSTIEKVVFDKTGTLTEKMSQDGKWPMREGCDHELTKRLESLGKSVFILSGDDDSERYKSIIKDMSLAKKKVICHPVFSSKYSGKHTGEQYKSILLSWLALPENKNYPEDLIGLVQAFHKKGISDEAKNDNIQEMASFLNQLEKDLKPINEKRLLYIDDGPGLGSDKPGCLTLQCTTNMLSLSSDGEIENPAVLPQVFEYMRHTQNYLNEQLQLAMLYNIIAVPLMAGAFSFWLMPAPWMGAVLMNTFSVFLIYRSSGLEDYLNNLTLTEPNWYLGTNVSAAKLGADCSKKRSGKENQTNLNDCKFTSLMESRV